MSSSIRLYHVSIGIFHKLSGIYVTRIELFVDARLIDLTDCFTFIDFRNVIHLVHIVSLGTASFAGFEYLMDISCLWEVQVGVEGMADYIVGLADLGFVGTYDYSYLGSLGS